MDPCPGNWVAIGRAVVYYVWAAQAFSAGIKCPHCTGLCYHVTDWMLRPSCSSVGKGADREISIEIDK